MDLLFSPRVLARAVTPWIAVLLAVVGSASVSFELFSARPEVRRFANEGRSVEGTVLASHNYYLTDVREAGPRNRSLVGVNDPELGLLTVSVYGELPHGMTVPMRCLTSARRCVSAAEIRERLDLWPLTPTMLAGGAELALAGLLAVAARRHRRPRDSTFALSSSARDVVGRAH